MEWGRAKKFVIILLVILNAVLAGLNYRQRQANTMTAAQERAIFEVLSQNGIGMYTELPTQISARARISAKMPEYSKETLERLFFGSEKTVVTVRGEQRIYRGENVALTMSGTRGLLLREDVPEGKGEMTKQEAEEIAQRFIDGTEHFFGAYGTPMVTEKEKGFQVDYHGLYKREQIFANYFSFTVTDGGIRQIRFSYAPIQGYSGEKRDLCYPDEALLTFMRERKKEGAAQEAAVQHMELGYDRIEKDTAAEGDIYLEPCYRIHVVDEEEPYLVNAYTCQIVHKD
ncbi:MAG: two-component system regulatory protein YycI [Bacillota bacterium]|nr:two-component system regulatory protein YycI [Bacillota bacterium]